MSDLYLTNENLDVNPGSTIEKYLRLTRGSGVVSKIRNSVTTVAPGDFWTETAGGTIITWYSAPLDAVTIGAQTLTCNVWGLESNAMANNGMTIAVLVKSNDATTTVATIFDGSTGSAELGTVNAAVNWTIVTTGASVASGERIAVELRAYAVGVGATGHTLTANVNGTTAAASGDSYVRFAETITEFTGPDRVPRSTPYPQLLAH